MSGLPGFHIKYGDVEIDFHHQDANRVKEAYENAWTWLKEFAEKKFVVCPKCGWRFENKKVQELLEEWNKRPRFDPHAFVKNSDANLVRSWERSFDGKIKEFCSGAEHPRRKI